jgi:hypothetical protein
LLASSSTSHLCSLAFGRERFCTMNSVNPKGVQCEVDDRRQNRDRRNSPRRKTLKGGRAVWPNGDCSECVVCNLSETGANLQFCGPTPNSFDLFVECEGWRRQCSVIWRKANRVGVKFEEPSRLASTTRNAMGQISELKRYADECRRMAGRVGPQDHELLVEMAEAWLTVVRWAARKVR